MTDSAEFINKRLRSAYEERWQELAAITSAVPGCSSPLLVAAHAEYATAERKLLVVGQQTASWGGSGVDWARPERCNSIDGLLDLYREFDLGYGTKGLERKRSPFWHAAWKLNQAVTGTRYAFVWSNLVKVDQDEGRPAADLEESVCRLGLLQTEIEVLRPDVVVFFTGPDYEDRLTRTFPGMRLESFGAPRIEKIQRLVHPSLPWTSLRTYHPNYLRRSGNSKLLDVIAQTLRGAHGIGVLAAYWLIDRTAGFWGA